MISRVGYVLVGLWFLIVPFIPIKNIFGDIKGFEGVITPFYSALSLLIVLCLSWVMAFMLPDEFLLRCGEKLKVFCVRSNKLIVFCLFCLLPLLVFLIDKYVFLSKPHLVDSAVQLFQGKIFASGRIVAPLPSYPEFFMTQHMLFDDHGWYGQYPPLHSLFLMLGVLAGAPHLVSVFMSFVTCFCMYKFVKSAFGKTEAIVVLALCCISPFFLFMSASFMNHVSSLMLVSLFLCFFQRWRDGGRSIDLFLASLFGGSIFLVRPLNALALLLPFVFPAVKTLVQVGKLRTWLIPIATFSFLLGGLAYFNLKTTGSPTLIGYVKLWGSEHGLGFHDSPWGERHTPIQGVENELADLQLLQEMLFEWPIPSLLPLALFLIFSGRRSETINCLLLGSILVPIAYFFYWYRDAFLGPRFQYDSIGYLLPLLSVSLVWVFRASHQRFFSLLGFLRPVRLSFVCAASLLLSLTYAIVLTLPFRVDHYQKFLKSFKISVVEKADAQNIERGLVFVKVSWGNRMYSQLRGLGLEPTFVQKVYSWLDHCLLFETILQAEREHWPLDKLRVRLQHLRETEPRGYTQYINGDPSLLVKRGGELSDVCADEVRYDNDGDYTIYTNVFRENEPAIGPPFVIARDMRGRNARLRAQWPELPVYIFNGDKLIKQ